MSIKSYKDAINEAPLQEMKDENVVIMGEDVAGGQVQMVSKMLGRSSRVTKGLLGHYGEKE